MCMLAKHKQANASITKCGQRSCIKVAPTLAMHPQQQKMKRSREDDREDDRSKKLAKPEHVMDPCPIPVQPMVSPCSVIISQCQNVLSFNADS